MPIFSETPFATWTAQATQRSALGGPSPSLNDLYGVVLAQQEAKRKETMAQEELRFRKEEAALLHEEQAAQTRAQSVQSLTQLPITSALTIAQLKKAGLLGAAAQQTIAGPTAADVAVPEIGTVGPQAPATGGTLLPSSIFAEGSTASWGSITGTQIAGVGGLGFGAGVLGAQYGPGKKEDIGRIGTFGLAKGKTASIAGGSIKGAGAGALVGVWFGGVGAAVGAIGGAIGGAVAGAK